MTTQPLTVYSTPWCGYCIRLKSQLKREGINFVAVDISRDAAAAAVVQQVNGGNQTVPTVVFADGHAMSNPSLRDIQRELGAA